MRTPLLVLASLVALVAVDFGGRALYGEYRQWRDQRAQVTAVVEWMLTPVGTRTVDGKPVPLNRADAIAEIVTQALHDAPKKQ